jgi:site-specific recombinase XerD
MLKKGVNMYKRGGIYYERFVYPDGTDKRKCLKTGDRKLAQKIKAKITTDILMDKHYEEKNLASRKTVQKMIDEIYPFVTAEFEEDSIKTEDSLTRQINNRFGKRTLASIVPIDLAQWEKDELGRGLKRGTVSKKIRTFKKYWELARKKYKMTNNNPFEDVICPKDETERVRYLTDEEREKLLGAFSQSKYLWLRDYVVVACDTGLRRKNMCNMGWHNVDWKKMTLNFLAKEMKGKKAHSIPMGVNTINVLTRRLKHFGKNKNVFLNAQGNPIVRGSLSTQFTKLTRKYGVEDFHLHDMRHDFCSQLARGGAEIYDIRDMAGHTDIKMTMRYTHLMPERKKKVIDILNKQISPKLKAVR